MRERGKRAAAGRGALQVGLSGGGAEVGVELSAHRRHVLAELVSSEEGEDCHTVAAALARSPQEGTNPAEKQRPAGEPPTREPEPRA